MKKIKSYILPAVLLIVTGSSCKKFLDINKDPNNPADVQESMLLYPIETATSTVVAGGSLTIGNYTSIAITIDYFLQQIALNQVAPQADTYLLRPADLDQAALVTYSTILQNLRILNQKAEKNGNHSYGVIAKVLTAYNLGVATDIWGDIPYSKGFDGKLQVPYDKQEDVYKTIQSLLDSAILENTLAPGILLQPGKDDVIYFNDGDPLQMSRWVKFAYTLKARYYMHLTKAPGYDAATQSNLALAALANGFSSQADEANFAGYTGSSGGESPWFQNIDISAGPTVLASTFVDSLVSRNDPRLPIMVAQGSNGTYNGRIIGTEPDGDPSVYSLPGAFYSAKNAPQSIMSYSEALFIKAEATFRTAGAAAATPIYQAAIKSHMIKLGLGPVIDSPEVKNYLAARGTLTNANGIRLIMEEKTIANFLAIENYNDWRRTGFPALTIVQNPHIPSIPRRFPYPLAEITANPQPEQSATLTDRVWWDAP
ncbi:SusD/RagB family nutrient-binding outer membrane lipoprotein [Flavitalea flava]